MISDREDQYEPLEGDDCDQTPDNSVKLTVEDMVNKWVHVHTILYKWIAPYSGLGLAG